MRPGPTRLESALYRAREQRGRLAQQQELVAALKRSGQDALLDEAVETLTEMTRISGILGHQLRSVLLRP